MTMKFVLATQNPKKLKEMSAILGELGVEVVSEADLGVKIEVEETGETFAENSLLKAKAVMEATKLPAIADDSGLCVDARISTRPSPARFQMAMCCARTARCRAPSPLRRWARAALDMIPCSLCLTSERPLHS